jgi:hypothetical protein
VGVQRDLIITDQELVVIEGKLLILAIDLIAL